MKRYLLQSGVLGKDLILSGVFVWRFSDLGVFMFCHTGQLSIYLYTGEHYEPYDIEPDQEHYTYRQLSEELVGAEDVGRPEYEDLAGDEQENGSHKTSGSDPSEG